MIRSENYAEDMPIVHERLLKYERALASVRQTHRGCSEVDVRAALDVAFEEEGVEVWSEVADDAARTIAGGG